MSANNGIPSVSACTPKNTTIETINQGHDSFGFQAKRRLQSDEKAWWEHTAKVEVAFCGTEFDKNTAKSSVRYYFQDLPGYDSSKTTYAFDGNKMTATFGYSSYSCGKDDMSKRVESAGKQATQSLKNTSVESLQVCLDSEQKKKVHTYPVWDGVDRFDPSC